MTKPVSIGSLGDQLRMILSDQQRELKELREDRRKLFVRQAELDAKEIEMIIGIQRTKEVIAEYDRERGAI